MRKILFFAFVLIFSASCSNNTFKDKRDNKVYKTIRIGNKIWMAEDLKFDMNGKGSIHYPNEMLQYNEQQLSEAIEFYKINKDSILGYKGVDLLYKINPSLKEVIKNNPDGWWYYNYSASRIACPEGWRLPSVEDWNELNSYINDSTKIKLDFNKVGIWSRDWYSPNHNPIMQIRLGDYFGEDCNYWTSTETSENFYFMKLWKGSFTEDPEPKSEDMNYMSICIRCVKDVD